VFCTQISKSQNNNQTLILQLLLNKLQYIMHAITSPSNNFSINKIGVRDQMILI